MKLSDAGKDLGKVVLDSIEVKIDFKKLFDGVLEGVIEKALDEVVKDSANTWDDSAKAILWPLIEPKIKDLVDLEAAKLQAALDAKIKAIKDSVVTPAV